jgi:hypothetical protein
MPWLIADTVCGEVARFLGVEIPARYSDWLDAKAERCYARHDHFRKLMRGRGNAPRDWLYAFMRHWLAAILIMDHIGPPGEGTRPTRGRFCGGVGRVPSGGCLGGSRAAPPPPGGG